MQSRLSMQFETAARYDAQNLNADIKPLIDSTLKPCKFPACAFVKHCATSTASVAATVNHTDCAKHCSDSYSCSIEQDTVVID